MNRAAQLKRFQPIERLRRLRGSEPEEQSEIGAALTRLSQTPDGKKFLDWLWLQTKGKTLPADASDGAFREHNAVCTLFDRILRLVEEQDDGKRRASGHG